MVRRLPPSVPVTLAALLALAGGAGDVCAGRAEGELRVSARVPVQLDVRWVGETPVLTVTADDLAAGVKDVPGAVLSVRTNTHTGYVLELGLPEAEWLTAVEVHAAGAAASGAPGAVVLIAVPDFGAGESLTSLDLRLRLAPGTRPGTYALPIALGVAPL
jgi:hypothetical protein